MLQFQIHKHKSNHALSFIGAQAATWKASKKNPLSPNRTVSASIDAAAKYFEKLLAVMRARIAKTPRHRNLVVEKKENEVFIVIKSNDGKKSTKAFGYVKI